MEFLLSFEISLNQTLDSRREFNPFMDVYLTSDLRSVTTLKQGGVITMTFPNVGGIAPHPLSPSQYIASDTYQSRLIEIAVGNRLLNPASHQKEEATGLGHQLSSLSQDVTTTTVAVKTRIDFTINARDARKISRDAAVCVHSFCEVDCHEGAWGSHTCGWGCCTFYMLHNLAKSTKKKSRRVEILISDTGASPHGSRGRAEIIFDEHTRDILANALEFSVESPLDCIKEGDDDDRVFVSVHTPALAEYYDTAGKIFDVVRPTTDDIRRAQAPMYSSCGNMIVRPPCSFVMTKEPPLHTEEYLLRALDAALARKFCTIRDPDERLKLFLGKGLSADEMGAILMDVAMFFPTACVYLFDEVFSRDGTHLIVGEEFSRCAYLTVCADCEDFAFCATVLLQSLSDTRLDEWKSEAVRLLRKIRLQYFVTIPMKAVTKPSVFGKFGNRGGFGAHDCCDLIPVVSLCDMVKEGRAKSRHHAIARIVGAVEDDQVLFAIMKERIDSGDIDDVVANRRLSVVVGEGTGRTTQFVREGDPALSSSASRKLATSVFTHAGVYDSSTVIAENNSGPVESEFYQYTNWAIVHDSIVYSERHYKNRLCSPYIVYLLSSEGEFTYGVPHRTYLSGRGYVVLPLPGPNEHQLQAMYRLEKYEHPRTSLGGVTRDTKVYAQQVAKVTETYSRVSHPEEDDLPYREMAEIYVPLYELTDSTLQSIAREFLGLKSRLRLKSVRFEHVFDGVAFAAFFIGVI